MGKNVALRIKKSKPFYPADLIVYLCVALAVISVFIAVATGGGAKSVAAGFTVLYDNRAAAEYRFSNGQFTANAGFEEYFSVRENGVYFYPDGETNGN